MKEKDFVIILAWPEGMVISAGAWYDKFLSTNGKYRVGHSALALVNSKNNKIYYLDFGRYQTPHGFARIRDSDTDPDTIVKQKSIIKKNNINNIEDILIEIIPAGFQFILCFENIEQIPFDILNNSFEMILAYEPVWAIGTGETASIEHINEIHKSIKSELSKLSLDIPLLYGGSVNPTNSKEILSQELVDGVLVGCASTKYKDLHKIINSI